MSDYLETYNKRIYIKVSNINILALIGVIIE